MKFQKRPCSFCAKGIMLVQRGRRGFYYQCNSCKATTKERPKLAKAS